MNFKMIVVVLGIAVVPVCVQAQAPNPPKARKLRNLRKLRRRRQ